MPRILFEVGDRVGVNDYVGTVKYKGTVENAKGEYYGIEWDLSSRGKHNGTHLGKSYFTTQDGIPSGSFIREKMIHPSLTCLEAIKDKYGKVDDEFAGVDESNAYLNSEQAGDKVINIEVVGMKQINDLQSQFDILRIVDLHDMCIYGEEDCEALGQFIPLVEELNLSGNLLASWGTVAHVIKHLHHIKLLYLSRNRLTLSARDVELIKPAFRNIQCLVLNMMNLTWEEILASSELWLQVKELRACMNRVTEIASAPNWQHLTLLDLSANSLKSWSNVKPFSTLPRLHEMQLAECELVDITVEEGDFPSLHLLGLASNSIAEWRHVGQLNTINSLTEVVLRRNPVLDLADEETNRQLIIAKILHLTKHNGTTIDSAERKGAEIDYTKRYGEMWIESGASLEPTEQNNQLCVEHPTYLTLVKKWGAPEITEVKKSKPKSAIKESLIELTFVDLVTESGKTITKYIPETMSVVKCRNLAVRLLGIKGRQCVISYRAHQNGEEYDLEYDLRSVTFYGVQHGDEILLRHVS